MFESGGTLSRTQRTGKPILEGGQIPLIYSRVEGYAAREPRRCASKSVPRDHELVLGRVGREPSCGDRPFSGSTRRSSRGATRRQTPLTLRTLWDSVRPRLPSSPWSAAHGRPANIDPSRRSSSSRLAGVRSGRIQRNEANISTAQPKAPQGPWLSCTHEVRRGTQGTQPSPRQGSSATHRLHLRLERLRTRDHYRRIYSDGVAKRSEHVVLISAANEVGCRRVGVVASRKVGNAVRRNRAKRLLRVAARAVLGPQASRENPCRDRTRLAVTGLAVTGLAATGLDATGFNETGCDVALIARVGLPDQSSVQIIAEVLRLAVTAGIVCTLDIQSATARPECSPTRD